MTAILPAAGTTPVAVTATGQPPVLATVPDAPPAAARLDPGTIVTGTVLGRDAQGLVTIRTDKGVLSLQTNANLPVGSTVSLEVRVAGTRLQLVVLHVEAPPGQSTAPGITPGATPATTTGTPAAGAPPSPAANIALALSGGQLVMATVVHTVAGRPGAPLSGMATPETPGAPPSGARLPSAAGVPSQSAPSLPGAVSTAGSPAMTPLAGQTLQPAIAALTNSSAMLDAEIAALLGLAPRAAPAGQMQPTPLPTPLPQAPGAPGQPMTPTPQPGLSAQPQTSALVQQSSAKLLPAGAEIGLRILAVSLPGEPLPQLPGAGAASGLPATVTGQTPAGHPIVDSAAGRLVLALKGTLPVGTALIIELVTQLAADDLPPPSTPQQALLRLSREWPALGTALAALGSTEAAAAQALAARLPQTGPQLAAGMLAMLRQLASGDVAEWLAPALREALDRIGRRDIADRLGAEFGQLSRLASEPSGGDWRVMFLPLRHDGELHQLNLYIRGRRKGERGPGPDTGTRFIVEVDMTRLGPLQLDGLVQGRRFDLMLRSRQPLAPTMLRDIEAIFAEARSVGGFVGTIGFQVAQSFPVQPLEQAKRNRAAPGVVV